MPWHLEERSGQTCVVKDGDTSPVPGGCHATRSDAERHLAALYANESSAAALASARAGAATEPFSTPFPAPEYPPRSWFTDKPDWLTPGMKLRVDDDGRVAGYFYKHGQALVHDPTARIKPSPTRYAAFHQNGVILEDGEFMQVGVIGNVNGHAHERAPISVAMAHYADPDRALVHCRAYDDDYGGYVLGAMLPGKTYGDKALLDRSALSGDWRATFAPEWWQEHGIQANVVREVQGFDCVGPTLVTRPGLPLIQPIYADGVLVAMLGGMGGVQLEEGQLVETKIEVPGGTVITTNSPLLDAPPTTTGADVRLAQPPPPEEDGGGEPTMEQVAEAISALDARITAIEDMLAGQAQAEAAAIAASVRDLVVPFATSGE